jgi:hypothetical protein
MSWGLGLRLLLEFQPLEITTARKITDFYFIQTESLISILYELGHLAILVSHYPKMATTDARTFVFTLDRAVSSPLSPQSTLHVSIQKHKLQILTQHQLFIPLLPHYIEQR